MEMTTRTWTSPKRFGTSAPVKVPFSEVGDGDGDGVGEPEGVTDGDEVAAGEGDGLFGTAGL